MHPRGWLCRQSSARNHQASLRPGCLLQAYEGAAQIIMAGTDSVLRAMETYTKQAWVLRAWQDVFVDLVQGQLQHLYVSLLSSELALRHPVHHQHAHPSFLCDQALANAEGLPAAALHVPLSSEALAPHNSGQMQAHAVPLLGAYMNLLSSSRPHVFHTM